MNGIQKSKNKLFRAIIVDDETLARKSLKKIIRKSVQDQVEVIGEASNGLQALNLIDSLTPNLIFLDIQMPGLNGFEVLQQLDNIPPVIFTTAYDKYALKAFQTHAIDYLLKPVKKDRLIQSIEKLEKFGEMLSKMDFLIKPLVDKKNIHKSYMSRFAVKSGNKRILIQEEDVIAFFSKEKYCYIRAHGIDRIINMTLQELELKLDPDKYIRIHRSAIIPVNQIASCRPIGSSRLEVTLKDGFKLVSSRSFSKHLKFNIFS